MTPATEWTHDWTGGQTGVVIDTREDMLTRAMASTIPHVCWVLARLGIGQAPRSDPHPWRTP